MMRMRALLMGLALGASATVRAPWSALVVGGSGRVGGSTVRWLHELSQREGGGLSVAVGGRSAASFERAQQRLARQGVPASALHFVRMDAELSVDDLREIVRGRAIVAHTAGPFQGRRDPTLLRACLAEGVAYVDVCDEWELARLAKEELHQVAIDAEVPAVTAAGIWPGASALMAAEATSKLGGPGACKQLDLSFFTAGTGNAGPTIVSATFLLLCQGALTYVDGREERKEPWTERRDVDFGPGVGRRAGWLLDNPDVPTCHRALGVPSVASRFGTAPMPWNYCARLMRSPTSELPSLRFTP
eukprot:scaffold32374_cov31-Tisochrysis_lutea.AAC.2